MLHPSLIALSLLICTGQPKDASRLAVIQKAPQWLLTDQEGRTVRSRDLDGTVLLVSFIFTTCSGSCPATTANMVKVQEALKKRGLLKNGKARLVSITLDPDRDTPKKLKNYMEVYEADPASWSFLTGPKEKLAKVTAAFGMWARPGANGQLDHPSRIFLVDGRGRVREIYNLSFLKPAWVVEDVELLIKEAGKGK